VSLKKDLADLQGRMSTILRICKASESKKIIGGKVFLLKQRVIVISQLGTIDAQECSAEDNHQPII
jgi:hypothetical protein